jgi:DNA replication protein DnaC
MDRRHREVSRTMLLELCGVPPRVISLLKEEDFSLDGPLSNHLSESVYLWGPPGSGKTVMAVRIMAGTMVKMKANLPSSRDEIVKALSSDLPKFAKEFRFVSLPLLYSNLRSLYSKLKTFDVIVLDDEYAEQQNIDPVDQIQKAKYVILDDLGAIRMTPWAYETTFQIIEYRYNWVLPTVFTSNFSLKELAERLSNDKIPTRISEMCKDHIVHITKSESEFLKDLK